MNQSRSPRQQNGIYPQNAKNEVSKHKIAVLKIGEDWCEPCKRYDNKIDELLEQYPEVTFLKVECDLSSTDDKTLKFKEFIGMKNNPRQSAIPHIAIFIDGVRRAIVIGDDLSKLRLVINQCLLYWTENKSSSSL